jgi:hypothetical protein
MRRDRIGKIVEIGNGLCRVIVRSERQARQLAELPDVQLIDQTADNLGWWLVFPSQLRPVIEPVFRTDVKTIITRRRSEPEQLSLLGDYDDELDDEYEDELDGDHGDGTPPEGHAPSDEQTPSDGQASSPEQATEGEDSGESPSS